MTFTNKDLARILKYLSEGFALFADIVDPQERKTR